MKTTFNAIALLLPFLFVAPFSKAEPTNEVSVAGQTISVCFPSNGLDSVRRAFVVRDAARYFSTADRLEPLDGNGSILVPVRSSALVARNGELETGVLFEAAGPATNMVVSETLSNRYAAMSDWSVRTNLLAKADDFLDNLSAGPVGLSPAERRNLFRRCEEGSLRAPFASEASDDDVVQALSDIANRFRFSGACLLELELSSETSCWTLPLRYSFETGTNEFERAVLSTPSAFVDGSWRLLF